MVEAERYVLRFAEIGHDDIALVGGKNASLGEMHNELSSRGIRVPNGFAIKPGPTGACSPTPALSQLSARLCGSWISRIPTPWMRPRANAES